MSFWFQKTFNLKPRSAGCYLITDQILAAIGPQLKQVQVGLCNLFLNHTSAGLIIGQNYDPTVRQDMQNFFNKIVPQGNFYEHDSQGPDDMPAHIKSALTGVSLTIPISKGQLLMGTWQGVWLMEYRSSKHNRNMTVTINGQKAQK